MEIKHVKSKLDYMPFDTINMTEAISAGLIEPERDPEDTGPKPDVLYPFKRITNWYGRGEAWMLTNAINQLSGCAYLLVSSKGLICIYRGSAEVKEVESLEAVAA